MTDIDHAELEVLHEEDSARYVLQQGPDAVGTLHYHAGESVVDIYSTQISPARRGHGLGEVLVRRALDDLREQGRSVRASCWFVADFLDANPDYQDLRAS